jgi:opacity protein-like surface antigen
MENFTNNIKKSLIATSVVGLVISLFSSNVHAAVNEQSNFYVGAGVGYNRYGLSSAYTDKINAPPNKGKSKTRGSHVLMPLIGIKYQENYGAEVGYTTQNKLSFDGNSGGHLRIRNCFLDLMGYMPLESKMPIDLVGGLGIGHMKIKEKSTINAVGNGGSYTKFGFRVKFGAEYLMDKNWSLRGLLAYQRVGHNDGKHAIKNMQTASLDVIYLI